MNLKPTLLATALAVACGGMVLTPQAANAADSGTITITGKVMNSTCNVTGNGGSSDFTVALPPVAATALNGAGVTAGQQKFSLNLSGCPTTPSGIKVGTQFYSSSANNGQLSNTVGPGYAGNVAVQLLDSSNNPITVGGSATGAAVTDQTTLSGASATLAYTAQYYATGTATAGSVQTTVQYVINYQ